MQQRPFELRNPSTGKVLDSNATMKIKLPDGTIRTTTVKAFYNQVNEMEKQLSTRGRSLRQPNGLSELRPAPDQRAYTNFKTNKFANYATSNFKLLPKDMAKGGRPQPIVRIHTTPLITMFNLNNLWTPDMYIVPAEEDNTNQEFPPHWAKNASGVYGTRHFSIIGQVPTSSKILIKKIVWQVSSMPFDETLKDINQQSIVKSFEQTNIGWNYTPGNSKDFLSAEAKQNLATSSFFKYNLELENLVGHFGNDATLYFIRAVLYNDKNEAIRFSPQLEVEYAEQLVIHIPPPSESNSVPVTYSYPDEGSNSPFAVYVKGKGFHTFKSRGFQDGDKTFTPKTFGYKIQGNVSIGVSYYNFLHIFDDAQPASIDYPMVSAEVTGVVGLKTGNKGETEPNGAVATFSALNGLANESYEFTKNVEGIIDMNKTFHRDISEEFIHQRFFLGPVPLKITAGLDADVGVVFSGKLDPNNLSAVGEIAPYITSRFTATGGADALIAYAELVATVDPLLAVNMPLTYSSDAPKSLSISTTVSGLKGKVYLKAGFYYPCASLTKIVGWLTGSEDLPLCECSWTYDIFELNGFEHKTTY